MRSLPFPSRCARTKRRDQAGDSWASMLFWGVVALVVIVVIAKMMNPKYNEYKLEQKLEEVVLMQGMPDSESFRKEIMSMAEREGLPIKEENIIVNRTAGSSTTITVTMDQEVDLYVTKYVVHTNIEKTAHYW